MGTRRFLSSAITGLIGALLLSSQAFAQVPEGTIRVGTFDSRCVAIAYGRSAGFMEYINGLKAELRKAREQGDTARAQELERLGPASQMIMHQQGFSTGSVGNIMDKIKDKLPAVAKKANVKLVVSKWEIFHRDGSCEAVDITDDLVGLFEPNAATLEVVEQVKKMDPVPMEQLPTDSRH